MAIVFGGLTPHAPVLIPDIGRHDTLKLNQTVNAMRELARQVVMQAPDVVVIVTPHSRSNGDGFGIHWRDWQVGDFAHYRAPQIALDAPGDPLLAEAIRDVAIADDLSVHLVDKDRAVPLDYGVSVPLYYLQRAGYNGAVVPITVSKNASREEHRRFGCAVAKAVSALGKSTVLLASGDLSHKLAPTAPAGHAPAGAQFDELLLKLLDNGNWDQIVELDEALRAEAGECGYRALLVLVGALEKSLPKANLLAYESPFGVGYATATIDVEEPGEQDEDFNPAGFARQVIDTYLQTDRLPPSPPTFPREPRGCFVCLKRDGAMQVCVGSVAPAEDTLAQEIARHALMAIQRYADRHEVTIDEVIHHLEFSIDLLDELEPAKGAGEIDPAVHGVAVVAGDRHGVLLPGRAETAEAMIGQALEMAGIGRDEPYELHRFRVERYAEQFRPAW